MTRHPLAAVRGRPLGPSAWLLLAAVAGVALLAVGAGMGRAVLGMATVLGGAVVAVAILKHPFLGLVLLVATVQQIGWTRATFGGGIIGFTDLITGLTVAGVLLARQPGQRPSRPPSRDLGLRLGILFILLTTLSVLFADRVVLGLIETQKLIGYLVLVYLTLRLADSPRRVRILVLALMLSTGLSAGVSIADYAMGTNIGGLRGAGAVAGPEVKRFSGSAGEAAPASKMMVAGVALATVLVFRLPRWRLLTLGTVLLGIGGIATTGTRSSLVIVPMIFAWMLWKLRHHRRFGAILILVPTLIVAALPLLPTWGFERLAKLQNPTQDTTAMLRYGMHVVGLDLLREHPLLGVGPGQFRLHFVDFEYRWLPGDVSMPLHNTYLAVAVEHGLPAAILFLAMLAVAWWRLHRVTRDSSQADLWSLAQAVEVAFLAYLLISLTGPNHRQMIFWLLFALALALARLWEERRGESAALTPAERPAVATSTG